MRTKLGWALVALGVLVGLLGAGVMVVLGPDSRFTTGPHAIETNDVAVVTAPGVITWADVQVDVLAEVPARKPIFVGVANSVDVEDFVGRTRRVEVTRFERPWTVATRDVKGRTALPGAPTALDWWIASSAGLGGASVSTELPDETVSLAILSVGSSNLTGLEVTVAYGVKGGFAKGAGLLLLGIGAGWLGLLLRRAPQDAGEGWDEDGLQEEVVYVYVDEHGVEHEISAEEARELEVVEEVEEHVPVTVASDAGARDHDVAPAKPVPVVPGILTAADIAAEESEPEPDAEQVLYVYVDEDGVEHEVSEEELAEFEIVDEEDES